MEFSICKQDNEQQLAFGEVYSPFIPDSHGDFMVPAEIVKSAHDFMVNLRLHDVDTNHDGNDGVGTVVQSFIARKGDPDFLEGSWVVAMHVPDPDMWSKIKNGQINGFSMEALVKQRERLVTIEVPEVLDVKTFEGSGDGSDHTHTATLKFDSQGKLIGGRTDVVNGHWHPVSKGTATDSPDGDSKGHKHRFSFKEFFGVPELDDAE